MPKNICPICSATHSRRGVMFTAKTLQQHIKDKHTNPQSSEDYEDSALDMADMIAGDESDGVFWGIAWEMGYGR